MFKIRVLLLIIVSSTLLFSVDNLSYFKKYILISKKISKPTDPISYNMMVQYDRVEFTKTTEKGIGIFYFYIIPYLHFNKYHGKHFLSISKKNKKYYNLKQDYPHSYSYPELRLKISHISLKALDKLESKFKNSKILRFLLVNLKADKRMNLKDNRFTNDRNTMKLGSIIERVVSKSIENKSIYFLEKVLDTKKYKMEVVIDDLCYGENRIDSCVGDDLHLTWKNGVLEKIISEEPISISSKKKKTSLNKKHLTKKKKNYGNKKVKVDNVERFKYSNGKYYLYFYTTKESCQEDTAFESKVNIKESFVSDINGQMIDGNYQWLKGRSIEKCFNGVIDNDELYFGI